MESLAAAAEVVEMSVDDFAEEGSEQYGLQDAAANDEAQRPAEEAAAAQDENIAKQYCALRTRDCSSEGSERPENAAPHAMTLDGRPSLRLMATPARPANPVCACVPADAPLATSCTHACQSTSPKARAR